MMMVMIMVMMMVMMMVLVMAMTILMQMKRMASKVMRCWLHLAGHDAGIGKGNIHTYFKFFFPSLFRISCV